MVPAVSSVTIFIIIKLRRNHVRRSGYILGTIPYNPQSFPHSACSSSPRRFASCRLVAGVRVRGRYTRSSQSPFDPFIVLVGSRSNPIPVLAARRAWPSGRTSVFRDCGDSGLGLGGALGPRVLAAAAENPTTQADDGVRPCDRPVHPGPIQTRADGRHPTLLVSRIFPRSPR